MHMGLFIVIFSYMISSLWYISRSESDTIANGNVRAGFGGSKRSYLVATTNYQFLCACGRAGRRKTRNVHAHNAAYGAFVRKLL